MTTTYGGFPGVQIEVAGGAITAVAIGAEEKLVLFGAANYQNDGSFPSDGEEDPLVSTLTGSLESPEQINARGEADEKFGSGSELADGMREALANGANIDLMYGVAPRRYNVVDEAQSTQSGTLNNAPIWEDDVEDESNINNLTVTDSGGTDPSPRYSYESPPSQPSDSDVVAVNPLTGEYSADSAPSGDFNFSYKYLDWNSAFTANAVRTGTVDENETGIYAPLNESRSVAGDLDSEVSGRRDKYQLVSAIDGAQPNSNEETTDSSGNYVRRDARYDTSSFSKGSVESDYYFKLAPVRLEDSRDTILGGVGGLFAGNPVDDPIYNDELFGYDALEQSFTKTDADNMRGNEIIPVRQNGSIRVKDNLSTSTESDWERDFWRRRVADRVILIGKTVGDQILGQINDEQTRASAGRLISSEIRQLVNDGLLRPNSGSEENWFVDVYPSSENDNEVKIDLGFTPFGIVKRVDETVTVSTSN